MEKQRIYSIKQTALNEADRLELAKLLVKAGYAVRIGREPVNPNSKSTTYKKFVEYWEENDE